MTAPRTLIVRLDNLGDVLLAGPAVRAVAASGHRVTMLCGRHGSAAAMLLPAVENVLEFDAPWIDLDGHAVERIAIGRLVTRLRIGRFDQAIILTSFHQSALPTALLLRLAGVGVIAGNSEDFPGTLLDIRHHPSDEVHEVERNLGLVAQLGHRLPSADDAGLRIRRRWPRQSPPFEEPYVVVHPGASVPARAWAPASNRALVETLVDAGWAVAITGSAGETMLTAAVAASSRHRGRSLDLGGRTSLEQLVDIIDHAAVVVSPNTGVAHLAAATSTPVVSLYAATIPAQRWRPWRTAHILLGDQSVACRGCRARRCPVAGHPCLDSVGPAEVVEAIETLTASSPAILQAVGR